MNTSVAVAHDSYPVYCTCRCVQHSPRGHGLSTYGRSKQCDQYKHCERSVSTTPTQCDCSHILALPGYAHAPFTSKFKGVCPHEPSEYTCQIWSA